jgi:hypothetical protein
MTPWIKMRTDLQDDPRVRFVAKRCGCNALTVTGALHALWSLADAHTVDGRMIGYDAADLDARIGLPGFAAALAAREVGWLEIGDGYLQIPRFSEHNGKSAKARAETAKRVRHHRETSNVTLKPLQEPAESVTPSSSLSSSSSHSSKHKVKKFADTDDPPLPLALQGKEFRAAWASWIADRAARGKRMTVRGAELQISELMRMDAAAAVAAINISIANGWTGIFPPQATKGKNGTNAQHARGDHAYTRRAPDLDDGAASGS